MLNPAHPPQATVSPYLLGCELDTMGDILIRFNGIKKAFGPKIVFNGLNLGVERGTVLTVVGGSGVGKSVMLKLLIGLLPADAGSIFFDGQDVTQCKEYALSILRQRIAMLFQGGALFDSLSVAENVAYGLEEHFRRKMTQNDIRERVAWALGLVDLPGIELQKNVFWFVALLRHPWGI